MKTKQLFPHTFNLAKTMGVDALIRARKFYEEGGEIDGLCFVSESGGR